MKGLVECINEAFHIEDYESHKCEYKNADDAIEALKKAININNDIVDLQVPGTIEKSKYVREEDINKDLFSIRKYEKYLDSADLDDNTYELAIAEDDNGAAYAWWLPNEIIMDIRPGWNLGRDIAKNPGGYNSNKWDIPVKSKLEILDGYKAKIYRITCKPRRW